MNILPTYIIYIKLCIICYQRPEYNWIIKIWCLIKGTKHNAVIGHNFVMYNILSSSYNLQYNAYRSERGIFYAALFLDRFTVLSLTTSLSLSLTVSSAPPPLPDVNWIFFSLTTPRALYKPFSSTGSLPRYSYNIYTRILLYTAAAFRNTLWLCASS